MKLLHSGKVRDLYADGDDLLLVASDRISIYDVVLPTPIPDKGAVLTQLSLWWFDRLADLVPHHVLSATDVPPEFAGRALRCRRLDMLPVECIARGYLAGLGLKEYEKHGTVSGVALPPGPRRGLPAAGADLHADHEGAGRRARRVPHVRRRRGRSSGRRRRSGCAPSPWTSTGAAPSSRRRTGSSSPTRSWSSASTPTAGSCSPTRCSRPTRRGSGPPTGGRPGGPQFSFDKQFVRDWSAGLDWDRTPPGPAIPPDVVAATRARYTEVYATLTGVHLGMSQ